MIFKRRNILIFKSILILITCMQLAIGHAFQKKAQNPPNVILILTDDQGIGDLGCHGNPWLKTPNLDMFYEQSVRLTDFHVSPYCTPTRAAIMTGRYPINNGAWATYKGRDALAKSTSTMANVFKQNGYNTALFGKWHLGDNYPTRPTDLGFETAIHHKAGGVGELSDYWGNSYFDDVYYVNNEPKQFEGYCTDIWFDETIKYIDSKNQESKPFFVYLATNAPHSPWIVDEKYAKPYQALEGTKINNANFYGMLANIDENFGKLDAYLKKQNLLDNTIVIYMTDNGTSGGMSRDGKNIGYNKGFRGIKGAKTEGGHRVPFFIRWPNGSLEGGRDINNLTSHVDILPTLANLCHLKIPSTMKLDGEDLSEFLLAEKNNTNRSVFIHNRQDWRQPKDVMETCVIVGKWRLINGNELYNVVKDPYQKNNVAAMHPEIVKQLLFQNKAFLKRTKENPEYNELPVSVIGNKNQKEIKLTIQHAIGEDGGIWKPEQVASGMKNKNNTHAIEVEKDGEYLISCRRWPKECPGPVWGTPSVNPKNLYQYETIEPTKVRIKIANQILEQEIDGEQETIEFKVHLSKGKTLLVNDFIEGTEEYGVYYTYISEFNNK